MGGGERDRREREREHILRTPAQKSFHVRLWLRTLKNQWEVLLWNSDKQKNWFNGLPKAISLGPGTSCVGGSQLGGKPTPVPTPATDSAPFVPASEPMRRQLRSPSCAGHLPWVSRRKGLSQRWAAGP